MGTYRSIRDALRFVRDNFIGLGVTILALILGIVLLAGCSTSTDRAAGTTSTTNTTSTAQNPGAKQSTGSRGGASSAYGTSSRTSGSSYGSSGTSSADGLPTIAYADLPPQAQQTIERIDAGGPYPYPRNDNVVFHNRNRVLPKQPDGYYREYTVKTPGLSNRGPRRIIKGRDGQLYYTADHYNTFMRIIR